VDVVFDQGGAWWGLRPKVPGVLAMLLATVVRTGTVRVVAAVAWAFAALANLLEFALQLRQPAPQFGVFRFQLGDPLLQRAHHGQDSGLGLRWDRLPERFGNRRLKAHTPVLRNRFTKGSAWERLRWPENSKKDVTDKIERPFILIGRS